MLRPIGEGKEEDREHGGTSAFTVDIKTTFQFKTKVNHCGTFFIFLCF